MKAAFLLLAMCWAAEARSWQWWLSAGVAMAGQALDCGTSVGAVENNPLMRGPDGRFGRRGVAIKISLAGGILAAQRLVMWKAPKSEPVFRVFNFAWGAYSAGVSMDNRNEIKRGYVR